MGVGKSFLSISEPALRRLPRYLAFLRDETAETISAPTIARALGLHEVQVRKDLSSVSRCTGRPKTGFVTRILIEDIERFLGYESSHDAVLVGVGNLGRALLSYKGFVNCGVRIVAAFDVAVPPKSAIAGVGLYSREEMVGLCRRLGVGLGVITVPAAEAQGACDALVEGGVRAVWNFAPTHLTAPPGVFIQNEDLATSLIVLTKHLQHTPQRPVKPVRRLGRTIN